MCVQISRAAIFLCQAEDGIRDLVRSRGLGDVYKRQGRDYDAAVMAGGHCGFGLGATPNAVANMNSLVELSLIHI